MAIGGFLLDAPPSPLAAPGRKAGQGTAGGGSAGSRAFCASPGVGTRLTGEQLTLLWRQRPPEASHRPEEPRGRAEGAPGSLGEGPAAPSSDSTAGGRGPGAGRAAGCSRSQPRFTVSPKPPPPALISTGGSREPGARERLGGHREKANPHRRGDGAEPHTPPVRKTDTSPLRPSPRRAQFWGPVCRQAAGTHGWQPRPVSKRISVRTRTHGGRACCDRLVMSALGPGRRGSTCVAHLLPV